MKLTRKTTPAPATLEDRASSASALAGFALDQFETAATALEDAAFEQDAVAKDALEESNRLFQLSVDAVNSRQRNRSAARKIRELVGIDA